MSRRGLRVRRGVLGAAEAHFWRAAIGLKLVRTHMPYWRVVVEAKLGARHAPRDAAKAVTGVFVWARTIEEAEGLATLALLHEGLEALTADAMKCTPDAVPARIPQAIARMPLGFVTQASASSLWRSHTTRRTRA